MRLWLPNIDSPAATAFVVPVGQGFSWRNYAPDNASQLARAARPYTLR